ncbi:MAG TPA: type IV pilus twitching motility protein PilT [Hyalangium sp.]|nr:type IV pilus twitching motility protein PilT [Hyalangium sp.]
MARLDPIIEKLFKDSGQELLIETGGGVNMRTPAGVQPVLKQNLTSQQILGAIAELVPAEQRATFPPEGSTAFPYAAPAGQVQVTLENVQGRVKVSLVPFNLIPPPAEEEKFELASPYEMLDLAAKAVDPVSVAQEPPLPVMPELELADPAPAVVAAPAPSAPPVTPAPIPAPAVLVPPPPAPIPAPAVVAPAAPAALPVAVTPAPFPAVSLPEAPVPAAPPAPAAPVAPMPAPVRAAPARPMTLPPVPVAAPAPAPVPVAAPAPVPVPAAAAPVGPVIHPPIPAPAAPVASPIAAAVPAAPAAPVSAPVAAAVPSAPVGPATLPPVPAAPVPVPAPATSGEEVQDHRKEAEAQMVSLMKAMLARDASDLHLTSETVPHMRIDGDMVAVEEYGVVTHEKLKAMLFSIAPDKNRKQWEELRDTDFAYDMAQARFRINIFEDRKGIGAVLRQIPSKIRTAEEIGLTRHVLDLCFLTKGLVLVTGPTGSGKSTTLAALIDYINRFREDHIITIEDPIEFVHRNKSCLVNQREVGLHTHSFKNALRAALREDPDVVLVGEMRDLETIATAIETAETGHLVFGTLHTNTAASTVDRIIDQFPADRQPQIRMMLSESLKGVIAQVLCKRIGGGRVAAQEVLLCTGSVSNLIREGKTFQIPSVMQTSRGQGMVTLNDSLLELVKKKVIEPNEALSKSVARSEMRAMLERAGFKVDSPAPAAASPAGAPAEAASATK